MKSGIYKITNLVNGKFYIGSSKDIDKRWDDHKQYLRGNYHCNPKLQHSWNFHGEDKFQFTIIEEVEPNEKLLLEREQYYLDTWQPYQRLIGYNICPKAEGGDNITHNPNREQFIETMREVCSGEGNPMFGKKHTDEAIKLQKDKAKGRYTLEWFKERYGDVDGECKFKERNTMLKDRKINYSYANPNKGIKQMPWSKEMKEKLSSQKMYLKTIENDLSNDVSSGLYTMKQLKEKYKISFAPIKRLRKKLLND